jgi:hypothetical protein
MGMVIPTLLMTRGLSHQRVAVYEEGGAAVLENWDLRKNTEGTRESLAGARTMSFTVGAAVGLDPPSLRRICRLGKEIAGLGWIVEPGRIRTPSRQLELKRRRTCIVER